ncbi:hypothetical protein KY289_009657 [Solanum tuberosum]|nr:hypothetical protein KY289_009657 [Solanum tuberosum]
MDFSDQDVPYPCLEIVESKQHSRAKVLTLKVHPPDVTDNFSGNVTTEKVLLLRSSTHQNVGVAIPPHRDEHLSSWRVPSSGFGEVRYTSGYWEWVEDVLARCKETLDNIKTYDAIFASMFTYDHNENVLQAFCENWRPSNNTVSTFVGELSISLWDLRTIRGLPVHGSFYDEVIPSAKELTHVDDQGKSFLPRSCSFLFSAFYRLTKGAIDEVSFREWTKFWFRGLRKYAEPSPRTSKKRTKPRINHDPSGNIDMSLLPRTEEENAPFVELGVEESFRDETYLAAFLACWLCKFVLPNRKADCIRANVFKVASLMAHGEIFSLAVPILESIYRGLRDISTSSNLGSCNTLLPLHYVYGWIGEYFETYFRVTHPQRVNVHDLHNLAMLQGKELHVDDSGKLSTSWSDFLIGLRSSFVTLRLDDELIVEPYSPHRFSRQFGYYQDVPGALIEHHYDGSLLALVQLWDSCVHLGGSSKIIIPMRPSNKGSLMTREYSEWWPSHREILLRRSTHIILRGSKKNDVSLPTKGEQLQEKLPHSLKSKVTPNIPLQSVRVVSKYKSSKGKATHVDNGVKGPLQTPKAASLTDKEVIDVTLKRKKPSGSSEKGVVKSLGIAPSCSNTSKMSISLHEIDISTSAASSSNESNVNQELHWKRLKKKPKDLNTQQCEFAELDSISIDTAIFEDGAAGSTMPLTELAHQLGLGDIPSDVDVFEDCITSSNSLNVAKNPQLPLVEVKSQAANEIQLSKPTVPFSEKVETSQNISTTNVEIVETSQIGCSDVSRDLVRPLLGIASNFEPQKTISSFNLSYIFGMWRTLFNVINLSPLEVLLEDFFKKHRDYDAARLSTSQKITRDSHQELLSAAQQCLDTANEERINMDKWLEELQKVLARAEKELKVWTSKKKKTISLIEDHQKRLSKNQETITNREDEIHAIEKIIPLSETEIKELAKLKEEAETSRHQILSHELFP